LRQQAYLTKGVRINFSDQRISPAQNYSFYFEGGLYAYVRYLTRGRNAIHPNIFYCSGIRNDIQVEVAFRYTDEYEGFEQSFANNIVTGEGGFHLTGFRAAMTRAFNDYIKKNGYDKNGGDTLGGDDIREGLTAVVSVKIREPQFEGQTKGKLGNPEAKNAVEGVVGEALADFWSVIPVMRALLLRSAYCRLKRAKLRRQHVKPFCAKEFLKDWLCPVN